MSKADVDQTFTMEELEEMISGESFVLEYSNIGIREKWLRLPGDPATLRFIVTTIGNQGQIDTAEIIIPVTKP